MAVQDPYHQLSRLNDTSAIGKVGQQRGQGEQQQNDYTGAVLHQLLARLASRGAKVSSNRTTTQEPYHISYSQGWPAEGPR